MRICTALAMCGAAASSADVHAGMVSYSGTADFYVSSSSSDVWGFGNLGTNTYLDLEFNLTVDDAPTTLVGTSIRPDLGSFVEGSITVDGTSINIVGLTEMIFVDNAGIDVRDIASFRFDAVHNGITLNLGIRFDMANTTFAFSGTSAAPPTFETHQSVYAEYVSGGGYQIRTVAGSQHTLSGMEVSSVPEPSSWTLLGCAAVMLCGVHRRLKRFAN